MTVGTLEFIQANMIDRFRNEFINNNYILINENDFGISNNIKYDFVNDYYDKLEDDIKSVHKDRQRARDSFEFLCNEEAGVIDLRAADNISLVNKNYEGERIYKRISLIDNLLCRQLSQIFLSIVSSTNHGIIGINLFRTRNIVTETRHRDFVNYVLIFCLNINGTGAVTQLTSDKDGNDILTEVAINPGDIFIFKDELFFHYTSPLIAIDDNPVRDVIIMTIGD
jgi:hypothetical protein